MQSGSIPVGWWIKYGPNPPPPFVGGSLDFLDRAFDWAKTYNVKVIIDLHAVPGSQNGNDHSGTRDGSLDWGTQDTINETVHVIDFLAERYGNHPNLYAVELLNEPHFPNVALETLTSYYKAGYNAVRQYSQTVYVVMSNRLGEGVDDKELLSFASGLGKTVIDVHYYNLYSDKFKNMTVQENIDYISSKRASQLDEIATPDGPLIFVGEWVAEWDVQGATKDDYERFARVQLQVYGDKASFGWGYWTLKLQDHNGEQHWSLMWMINQGYINL